MDEECEYLKNYLTHETKFLDYIKTNEEKQQARMNSIINTFDNLDKALGKDWRNIFFDFTRPSLTLTFWQTSSEWFFLHNLWAHSIVVTQSVGIHFIPTVLTNDWSAI